MAAVSLFWDTNMADVTSRENAVLFRNRFILRFLAFKLFMRASTSSFYLLPLATAE